jgi:hypothetical protein
MAGVVERSHGPSACDDASRTDVGAPEAITSTRRGFFRLMTYLDYWDLVGYASRHIMKTNMLETK